MYIRDMEQTIDDKTKPFITDQREQPSPEYLAWLDQEIEKGLDYIEQNPDKMIPKHEIWKKYGLEY